MVQSAVARFLHSTIAELEQDRPRLLAAYGPRAPIVVGFYQSREDNSFASYPEGSYFVWKAQLLLYVTQALQVLIQRLLALLAERVAEKHHRQGV